jgi:hypothetical protein
MSGIQFPWALLEIDERGNRQHKKEYYIKMTEVMSLQREHIECVNNNNDKDKCKELVKKFNEACDEAYKYKYYY